jgi:hypothetical protein
MRPHPWRRGCWRRPRRAPPAGWTSRSAPARRPRARPPPPKKTHAHPPLAAGLLAATASSAPCRMDFSIFVSRAATWRREVCGGGRARRRRGVRRWESERRGARARPTGGRTGPQTATRPPPRAFSRGVDAGSRHTGCRRPPAPTPVSPRPRPALACSPPSARLFPRRRRGVLQDLQVAPHGVAVRREARLEVRRQRRDGKLRAGGRRARRVRARRGGVAAGKRQSRQWVLEPPAAASRQRPTRARAPPARPAPPRAASPARSRRRRAWRRRPRRAPGPRAPAPLGWSRRPGAGRAAAAAAAALCASGQTP